MYFASNQCWAWPATSTPASSSNTTSYGVSASAAQQALLQPITGQSWHYDVAQLTIEFIPTVSSVTFFATFGSEEWPTYVGTSYIDGFGLYVNGTNVAGAVATGGGDTLAININHPDMTSIPGTELNAVLAPNGNPVLQFDVPVVAGQTNVFDIILADASDAQLDTTVYLSSFIPTPGGGPVDGDGTSEFTPILPSNPPDPVTGEFVIVLPDPPENTTIWIDPPVTTGYVYEVTGAEFATVTLPSLAAVADLDGYILTIGDDSFALAASTTFDFAAQGYSNVTSFVISGIDPDLGLDPADTQAFPIGVSLVDVAGDVAISITPVAAVDLPAVPAPATLPLLAGALAGFGFILRRKRSA